MTIQLHVLCPQKAPVHLDWCHLCQWHWKFLAPVHPGTHRHLPIPILHVVTLCTPPPPACPREPPGGDSSPSSPPQKPSRQQTTPTNHRGSSPPGSASWSGLPGTREVSPRPRPRRSLQQKQAPALGKAGRPAARKLWPQRTPHGGPPTRPSRPWGTPPLRASSGPGRSSGAGSRARARRSSPRPRRRPAGRPPAPGPARRR